MGTLGFGEHAFHTRADVARAWTVRHTHPVPTVATGDKPLQQGRSLAGSPLPRAGLLRVPLGVLAETGLIRQVLRPTDIRGVGILDDALPLVHRAAHHRGCPSPRGVASGITGPS